MDERSTKRCTTCGLLKTLEDFAIQKKAKDGRTWKCKECMKVYCKERYEKNKEKICSQTKAYYFKNKEKNFFNNIAGKKRAQCRKEGLPFDMDGKYLESIWTGVCPILGLELTKGHLRGKGKIPENQGELDRLVPSKEYVRGNVKWISRRANRIKNDASVEELEKVMAYMKDNGCE